MKISLPACLADLYLGMNGSGFTNVRLPVSLDPEVESFVSLEALQEKIGEVARSLPPLAPRQWEQENTINASTIRFMQFNLLAEGLSASPNTAPPYESSIDGTLAKASAFGGFDAVEDPEVCFDFNGVRRWRLLEEVATSCVDHIFSRILNRFLL